MTRILLISFLLLNSTNINAQNQNYSERKGIIFSFESGIANSNINFPSKKQSSNDLALNWKIGYMINPKVALLINGSISTYDYDISGRSRKRDLGGVIPSVQYHFKPKWWIQGGIGLGTDAPVLYDLKPENKDETKYYAGFGALSSMGYEIYKKNNFAVDLQARVNYINVNLPIGTIQGYTVGMLLGINFY